MVRETEDRLIIDQTRALLLGGMFKQFSQIYYGFIITLLRIQIKYIGALLVHH